MKISLVTNKSLRKECEELRQRNEDLLDELNARQNELVHTKDRCQNLEGMAGQLLKDKKLLADKLYAMHVKFEINKQTGV